MQKTAFDFCYNLESKYSKEKLNLYKSNLNASLLGTDNALTINIKDDTVVENERQQPLSKALQKAYSMSASILLNQKVNKSRNSKNCPPNSSNIFN